ncbi:MAG: hypothetical protein SGPRY_005173 [Prymnesium sp.]
MTDEGCAALADDVSVRRQLSEEEKRVLGGVTTELAVHVLEDVAEVVSSTVGCQGQAAPNVVLVMVGGHPTATSYMEATAAAAQLSGVCLNVLRWREQVTLSELEECLVKLSKDETVHGIVLQLPLPPHLDENRLLQHIADEKDIDGLKESNLKRFLGSLDPSICPCIGVACDETLRSLQLKPKALDYAQVRRLPCNRARMSSMVRAHFR